MIYWLVPILAFSVWPPFFDSTTILRSCLIALSGLFLLSKVTFSGLKRSYVVFGVILFSVFTFSTFINDIGIVDALFAESGRSFGLLTYLGLFGLFMYLVHVKNINFGKVKNSLFSTSICFLLYGILQIFDIDPIPWDSDYPGITLTLGNPNFASALVGILSSLFLFDIATEKAKPLSKKKLMLYSGILMSLANLYFAKSVQGFAILIIVLVLIGLRKWSFEKKKSKSVIRISAILSVSVILILVNGEILKRFGEEASVKQRLSYYSQVIDISSDHLLGGIGFGQLTYFSAMYRSPELVIQEGASRYLDRAHSVPLDFLVTHGLLGMILWIFFTVFVSGKALKMILSKKSDASNLYLTGIWFGYLFQSLISPDQVYLLFLGVFAAALIVRINQDDTKINIIVKLSYLAFALNLFFLILTLPTQFAVLKNELTSRDSTILGRITSEQYNYILNNPSSPSSIENVAFSLYQNNELLPAIVEKFVKEVPLRSQAWYLKSIVEERRNDLNAARDSMRRAHELDPFNPAILLGLGLFEVRSGNIGVAREYLADLKYVAPNTPNLEILEREIGDK